MNEEPVVRRGQFAYVCIQGNVFQDFSDGAAG